MLLAKGDLLALLDDPSLALHHYLSFDFDDLRIVSTDFLLFLFDVDASLFLSLLDFSLELLLETLGNFLLLMLPLFELAPALFGSSLMRKDGILPFLFGLGEFGFDVFLGQTGSRLRFLK